MTEKDFQQICETILTRLDKKIEYAELCEKFWTSNNRKGLIKDEAKEIKKELNLDFKLAGTDRMFYKDYFWGNIQLRFMIPYGHGMIDCSYRVFSPMSDNSIPSFSYRQIVRSVTGEFDNYERTFPTNTNIEQYKEILKFILELNNKIIQLFEDEIYSLGL
jgi:hypothetical protein